MCSQSMSVGSMYICQWSISGCGTPAAMQLGYWERTACPQRLRYKGTTGAVMAWSWKHLGRQDETSVNKKVWGTWAFWEWTVSLNNAWVARDGIVFMTEFHLCRPVQHGQTRTNRNWGFSLLRANKVYIGRLSLIFPHPFPSLPTGREICGSVISTFASWTGWGGRSLRPGLVPPGRLTQRGDVACCSSLWEVLLTSLKS